MPRLSKTDIALQGAVAIVLLCGLLYFGFRAAESGEIDFSQVLRHGRVILIPFAVLFAVFAAVRSRRGRPEEDTVQEIEDL
jgi:hypothetical protein